MRSAGQSLSEVDAARIGKRSARGIVPVLRTILRTAGSPPIRFVLWNGEEVRVTDQPPVAHIGIADRRALFRLAADPAVQFGELYMEGRLTIEGDLARLLEEVFQHARGSALVIAVRRWLGWLALLRRNPRGMAQHNARRHYDIGNAFYRLWLDETMTYSCAYFPAAQMSLQEAQLAKMEHIGRKLRLRPGQTVVEIGSGWGSLALHLAARFGVRVRAFNVSREQLEFSRARMRGESFADRVEFIEDDYRNIDGTYDAVVSVGMLEHVGLAHYREMGEVIRRCLKPSGLGLIQSIGRNRNEPISRWIDRHIFPGGHVPSLKQMMDIMEAAECVVLDVENLRLHYARTLEVWRANYERVREQVAAMFDEQFVRMWRLYLAGSCAAFRTGDMQLFQMLFAPRANDAVPWHRADLYA